MCLMSPSLNYLLNNLAVILLRVFEIGAGPLLHQCEMRHEVETPYEPGLSFGTERKVLNSVQSVSQTLINFNWQKLLHESCGLSAKMCLKIKSVWKISYSHRNALLVVSLRLSSSFDIGGMILYPTLIPSRIRSPVLFHTNIPLLMRHMSKDYQLLCVLRICKLYFKWMKQSKR
jgi:hypothetical protein